MKTKAIRYFQTDRTLTRIVSPPLRDAFIYGGALTLDVEFYVADRIALLANLRERCLWGGDTKKFHTQFGVGIKFVIN